MWRTWSRLRGLRALPATPGLQGQKTKFPRCLSTTMEENDLRDSIMSRTKIVTDPDECLELSRRMLRTGSPLGVDFEGVQLERLGLVQVRTLDGDIYLFRTGRNPELLTRGGLGEVLRDRTVVKVMHGAGGDCLAIYKEGVAMWGLYDTAIAHKVIQYQNNGESYVNSHSLSFNDVCDEYGVASNPMKKHLHGTLWKRQNAFIDFEKLPEDLAFYSAADVDSLLDLYDITLSLVDYDFKPLLDDLNDSQLIKAMDSENENARNRIRHRLQGCDIFLRGLAPGVNKADVYDLVCKHENPKRVLFSDQNRTAHVLLPDRSNAILAYKSLSEDPGLPEHFGQKAQASLMLPLRANEIYASALKYEKHLDKLKEQNYIVDQEVSSSLVDMLIRAKSPVVVDFHLHPGGTVSMEVFPCRYPCLKFNVSFESVSKGGLGELLASPDVVKVVTRIDTNNVYAALRACSSANYRPANFFDLNLAYRVRDYWDYGQSIFMATSPSIKSIMKKMGLPNDTKMDNLLLMYLHYQESLPVEILEFMSAKCQVDLDIGAQICYAAAKETRKQLRLKYETNVVHVELEKGPPIAFREVLSRFLIEQDLEFNRIVADGKQATVEMCYHGDKAGVISKLQQANLGRGVVVTATNVEVKAPRDARPVRLDTVRLTDVARSYDEGLRELGFHALLDKQPRRVVKEEDELEDIVEDEGGNSEVEIKARRRKKQALIDSDGLKTIFDK